MPDTRPVCPRCGALDFMLVKVAGGGQAHICATCHWPRPRDGDQRGGVCDRAAG